MSADSGKHENIATTVTEVSERVSVLIREEIELAKAEVTHKLRSLATGLAVGVAAGMFGFFAFITLLFTAAWGLNQLLGSEYLGFAIVTGALLVLTVAAGLFAFRKFRVGPPVPTQAIDEAQKIRATVTAKSEIGS
ncbi:MAG TPA: phage holin family protein [Solirubrobacteraceae bacterium]|nr:phage holin family protein [Solirubrobacteraceae bacterium]